MLSPDEFTVGPFASARPLSLILPRGGNEQIALIGTHEGAPTAVFLSGKYSFCSFRSDSNHSWRGLIVPDVRVEADEKSLFDPDSEGAGPGVVIRSDSRLVIKAAKETNSGQSFAVVLYENLSNAAGFRAAFSRWQVVIGSGYAKRGHCQSK